MTSLTIGLALLFGLLYQKAAQVVSPSWLAVASLHSIVSVVFLGWAAQKGRLSALLSVKRESYWLFAPAGGVLAVSVLAGLFTVILGGNIRSVPDWYTQVAFILWIPVVEEIVFRGFVSRGMERIAPGLWGMWFSALLFAWVHMIPTTATLFSGIPLGPFLLGLICEYLRRAGTSLLPAIIFHMVCNSTVVIFSVTDARWLDWLGWLYG